ncbi:MAG TPA: hypothetical protein VK841_09475 [Polyangiaceae bacterium]|nr:hypothetical protein [Polyangiaceae bacterium]
MMGAKSCNLEADCTAATVLSTATGVDSEAQLSGAEIWCALDRRSKRLLAKAYDALRLIDRSDWMVLWWEYGPRQPNAIATADFTAELSPLVRFTEIVEARRREMRDALVEQRIERADRAAVEAHERSEAEWREGHAQRERDEIRSAHIQQIRAWRRQGDPGYADLDTRDLNTERMCIGHRRARLDAMGESRRMYATRLTPAARQSAHDAIRRGTDAEVTRGMALEAMLNAKESGDAVARQAVRDARRAFVATAARQADRMLASASVSFQTMWWTL